MPEAATDGEGFSCPREAVRFILLSYRARASEESISATLESPRLLRQEFNQAVRRWADLRHAGGYIRQLRDALKVAEASQAGA